MTSIYKNEEIKNATYKFVLLQVVLLIGVYLVFITSVNSLNKNYINHNKVLAARLIALSPSMKNEIIKAYTKEINADELKKSKATLNEYGYKDTLDTNKIPIIQSFSTGTLAKIMIFLAVTSILLYICIIKEFIKVFLKIRMFSKAAEEIVEGVFNGNLPDNKEGDFYILGSQFNIMAKRLKESLYNLKEDKMYLKTIISDISHQLKTPLSALILYNGLLENEETMDLEERRDLIKSSADQLDRMDWLCKNLLKLARLETRAIQFNAKETSLYDTVRNSLSPILIKAQDNQQRIMVNIDENVRFKHDSEWLAEALTNIIKNATEHTKPGGTIEIRADETPLSIQLFIKDNGKGIPRKDINKIFNRFYKGENSSNPTSIGIGLALSKTIIEGQKGSISVKSEEGKGTEFNITFLKTIL